MDSNQTPAVFCPDESVIAVPLDKRRQWQIHESKTGQILRVLPRVPNVCAAAFSPDSATLYSVAGGVLYRQRAR